MSKNSISQSDANAFLQTRLTSGEKYTYREIKEALAEGFEGINDNQCSGLIHRAHSKVNGVLVKVDKHYQLRATVTPAGNGVEAAKRIIEEALREIELIPVKDFQTADEFNELIDMKDKLNALLK